MRDVPCGSCNGRRMRIEALSVRVGGKNIAECVELPVAEALAHFEGLSWDGARATVAAEVLREVRARLSFLQNVGLGYLTLDRSAATLSGGEAQRIRLASQIGSELTGVVYVLDEPSIGLHARDQRRLLESLLRLRDLGNTVLVVEHDEETIRAADHLVDFGPQAGVHGGRVVAEGDLDDLLSAEESFDRCVSRGPPVDSAPRPEANRHRQVDPNRGRIREQPPEGGRAVPARVPCRCDGGLRRRQEFPGEWDPPPRSAPCAERCAGVARHALSHPRAGACGQGRGHRPVPHRPNSA